MTFLRVFFLATFCAFTFAFAALASRADEPSAPGEPTWRLKRVEELADVWNGASVGFDFIVRDDAVYVGFYTYQRDMTIARRAYDSDRWELKTLPSQVGWDSHNSIAMAFDANDCLHVSGNMHASPLVYFRASRPNDVESLETINRMLGSEEDRVTYPGFLRDKSNRLIFTYRVGGSGNGNQIWNVYDPGAKTWSRLLDKPLFDGQGLMNAYFQGPYLAADGYFHVSWVWRDTPDCETNHDLSYARSPDLIHWENSAGEPIELPITLATGESVDPVPAGEGLLNPLVRLSFDQETRPVIAYTRYDSDGRLQIWVARREAREWKRAQATHWDLNWRFSGRGSIPTLLNFGAVSVRSEDLLAFSWSRFDNNSSGTIYLDAKTLEPREAPTSSEPQPKPSRPEYSREDRATLARVASDDPRLQARSRTLDVKGERWVFRWEAPRPNRDAPQPDGAPAPTKLRVYVFVRNPQ